MRLLLISINLLIFHCFTHRLIVFRQHSIPLMYLIYFTLRRLMYFWKHTLLVFTFFPGRKTRRSVYPSYVSSSVYGAKTRKWSAKLSVKTDWKKGATFRRNTLHVACHLCSKQVELQQSRSISKTFCGLMHLQYLVQYFESYILVFFAIFQFLMILISYLCDVVQLFCFRYTSNILFRWFSSIRIF